MNTVDIAIIAAVAFNAWRGVRVGFVMGLYQLIVLALTLVAAIALERPVAQLIEPYLPLGAGMSRLAAFVIILTLAGWVLGLIGSALLRPIVMKLRRTRAGAGADRVLGILPGALRGLLFAASFVFIARLVLPPGHELRELVETSALAPAAIALFERLYPLRPPE